MGRSWAWVSGVKWRIKLSRGDGKSRCNRSAKWAENERENVAKARRKGVAKARKSQILSKNMGESWVVLGWFLKKVGAKLGVF